MVKATESSEDKKDSTIKKKATSKKKAAVTGVWPCKINGCNKQFAREADLKRHQRTTKLHSMPGFACPQCDATFTRTDALRRHQKSRHNGVVIEPTDPEQRNGPDAETRSSGSQSRSPSATPSSKGKERATAASNPPPNTNGPSSYYRQHTASSTPYIAPRPIMDPHYSQIGLPTSATRLNAATNWGYPHPWPDGTAPTMGPISYHPTPGPMYYSHYRHPHPMGPPPVYPTPPAPSRDQSSSHSPPQANQPQTTSSPQQQQPPQQQQSPQQQDPSVKPEANTPQPAPTNMSVIDPSLDASTRHPQAPTQYVNQSISSEVTQAAMKAVLASVGLGGGTGNGHAGTPSEGRGASVHSPAPASHAPSESGGAEGGGRAKSTAQEEEEEEDEHAIESQLVPDENNTNTTTPLHCYGTPLERPEPMEHMLTEDGEPMLNPAELLTSESLASPPPS